MIFSKLIIVTIAGYSDYCKLRTRNFSMLLSYQEFVDNINVLKDQNPLLTGNHPTHYTRRETKVTLLHKSNSSTIEEFVTFKSYRLLQQNYDKLYNIQG